MTGVEKERNAEGKFRLLGDSVVGEERNINLSDLGFDIARLSQEVNALKSANKEQIQTLWKEGEIVVENF